MFGQCFGSVIVSQWRYAFNRNSSIHSGSFFFAEISRIVSSFNPFGIVSDSMSVTKPYLYSLLVRTSMLLILFLASTFSEAFQNLILIAPTIQALLCVGLNFDCNL